MFESCGTEKKRKKNESKKKKADKYNSIAPNLHKQPFQNEHQLTSFRGINSVQQ